MFQFPIRHANTNCRNCTHSMCFHRQSARKNKRFRRDLWKTSGMIGILCDPRNHNKHTERLSNKHRISLFIVIVHLCIKNKRLLEAIHFRAGRNQVWNWTQVLTLRLLLLIQFVNGLPAWWNTRNKVSAYCHHQRYSECKPILIDTASHALFIIYLLIYACHWDFTNLDVQCFEDTHSTPPK